MCCVEIAGAVYKERHDSVFSHSTYGQVVFGVQSVGLEGVYTGNVAVLINGYLIVNLNIAAVQNDGGSAVGNLVTGYVNICQLAALISVYTIFGCNSAGSFDSTIGTADAYILTGNITHHDILVQVNFINLLAINSSFFNISVVAIYNLAVLACFSCYCIQLAAVYCVSGICRDFTCSYTADFAVFIYGNLAVDYSSTALHVNRCALAVDNTCNTCCTIQRQFSTAIAYGLNAFQVFVQLNTVVGYVVYILCTGSYYYIAVTAYGCAVCIDGVNMSAVCGFAGNYAYVSACFNLSMFACFSSYFLQLLFGCSLTFTVSKASISSSCIAKTADSFSMAIHDYISCCYTASCPDSAFAAADVYKSVRIISCKINIVFQLNLNFGTIIADVNVLVTTEVNSFTGSYFRCFAAVSGQIPALVCVLCYFTNFLQLLFGCSLTFAVSKASISSSFIAKTAYGFSMAIHDYISCCYTASCPDSAFAAADVYKSVRIISCKINIVFQLNLNFGTIIADVNVLVTTEVNSFTGSYFRCFAAVSGQIPALVCVLCYFADFLQLLFGCSLTFAVSKASISSSCIAKPAYSCSSTIHDNTAIYSAAYCYTASCPDSAFATADAYQSVRIISCKINIVFQVNIIFLATVRIIFWGYSNVVTCGNSTVFECFCWRINSHRRSHACTGHNTCCNQHCQQLLLP